MSNLLDIPNRITSSDIKKSEFLKFPKFLFSDKYNKLSNDAKMLYMILRDRLDLSLKNNWVNTSGEVYIIYTREKMMEKLNKSKNYMTKICKELIEIRLISEQKQGLNKPNLIFFGIPVTTIDKGIHKQGIQESHDKGANKTYVNKTYKELTLSGESANMSDSDQQDINNNNGCVGNSKNSDGDRVENHLLTETFLQCFLNYYGVPHRKIIKTIEWFEEPVECYLDDPTDFIIDVEEFFGENEDTDAGKCNIDYFSKTYFRK
jgi:hypothetical protein